MLSVVELDVGVVNDHMRVVGVEGATIGATVVRDDAVARDPHVDAEFKLWPFIFDVLTVAGEPSGIKLVVPPWLGIGAIIYSCVGPNVSLARHRARPQPQVFGLHKRVNTNAAASALYRFWSQHCVISTHTITGDR